MVDKIKILFEDNDYLAVNKPAGLLVHRDGHSREKTLADWFVEKYPQSSGVGEELLIEKDGEEININRSGIVHRLDKDTSGVIVLCKNQSSFNNLKKQFKKRKVKKLYNTFVYGRPEKDRGRIDRAIGRSKNDFRKWTAQRGVRGKRREAQTVYQVLKKGEDVSFIEARPQTGRTHQIRVHLQAINHPVICDPLYAEGKECLLGFKRPALHARSIKFKGIDREEVFLEAPLPEDFKEAIDRLGN